MLNLNFLRKNTKYQRWKWTLIQGKSIGFVVCMLNEYFRNFTRTHNCDVLSPSPVRVSTTVSIIQWKRFSLTFFSSILINFLNPFGPGGSGRGAHCASTWHVFAYIRANTCPSLLKNLDFPNFLNHFENGKSFQVVAQKNWNPNPTQPQNTLGGIWSKFDRQIGWAK